MSVMKCVKCGKEVETSFTQDEGVIICGKCVLSMYKKSLIKEKG